MSFLALQDAIITFVYAGLFLLAAVLNMGFGIANGSVLLGLAAVSLSKHLAQSRQNVKGAGGTAKFNSFLPPPDLLKCCSYSELAMYEVGITRQGSFEDYIVSLDDPYPLPRKAPGVHMYDDLFPSPKILGCTVHVLLMEGTSMW